MEALPHEKSEQRIRAARFTYCPSSSFEFSVRLQNVLCVSGKCTVRFRERWKALLYKGCSFIRQLWCFCQRSVIFLTDSSDGFARRLWSEIVVDTKKIVATTKYFMVAMSRILTVTVTLTPTRYESVGNLADEVNKSRRGGQIVFRKVLTLTLTKYARTWWRREGVDNIYYI